MISELQGGAVYVDFGCTMSPYGIDDWASCTSRRDDMPSAVEDFRHWPRLLGAA